MVDASAGEERTSAPFIGAVAAPQTEELGFNVESDSRPRGDSAPEQLISEAAIDEDGNHSEDETGQGFIENDEPELTRLRDALEGQGLSLEATKVGLVLQLPAGRSHRSITIRSEQAAEALRLDFRGRQSLERFDGVWNQKSGIVEVVLRGALWDVA